MSTDASTDRMPSDAPERSDRRSPLQRQLPALLVLGAVALLLVGVAIGLMIRTGGGGTDRPAADSAAVGFAQDMSTHHSQGVAMAKVALTQAQSPEVRALAYDILTQQTNQMGQMQSWLTRWDQPLDNPGTAMTWMSSDGHDHAGSMGQMSAAQMTAGNGVSTPLMPGMATASEMATLQSLRGAAVDIDFLQLMLRHHRGGLPMMEYAVDKDHVSEPYVRELAQQMINIQTNEADTLAKMLAERGGSQLPMN
ncbi:DUF305 domain-containing protein [Williamsia maris]|uniref:Uncharacterized conserved protein, DUF305 family n=1 Tax=Williamsia maris TaxID=72806 RepID=A0ABT1H7I0_9NOCA|nr:DUF305 domain-containing protein [Williamsia maris]MCP2174218.1 Uncharacterized conserved protein, DUF305 family [Williamsia maris]